MKIFTSGETKIKDYSNLTGDYRGAAHNICNINYKNDYDIPVIFHNLSRYDSHFIIRALSTYINGHINLLPINKDKYISFTKKVQLLKLISDFQIRLDLWHPAWILSHNYHRMRKNYSQDEYLDERKNLYNMMDYSDVSFIIQNLYQYAEFYLKTDVLLLADVFENFQKTCKKRYYLDPAHYYTVPGFTLMLCLRIINRYDIIY